MLPNSRRIPLETAHEFLATFGITQATKQYERWVKADGFDFDDFPTVLSDSPFIIGVDWRAALEDVVEFIAAGLAKLDVALEYQFDPETNQGTATCNGETCEIKYVASDDDFTDVIRAVQSIVPATVEFRASPSNGDNDGWDFAVLPRDEWADLERLDADLLHSLYLPLE